MHAWVLCAQQLLQAAIGLVALVCTILLHLIHSSQVLPVSFGAALLLLVRFELLALNPILVGTLDPAESKQLDHIIAPCLEAFGITDSAVKLTVSSFASASQGQLLLVGWTPQLHLLLLAVSQEHPQHCPCRQNVIDTTIAVCRGTTYKTFKTYGRCSNVSDWQGLLTKVLSPFQNCSKQVPALS